MTAQQTLGRVGLPMPVAELAGPALGRGRGRRRAQRAHRGRLPGPGRSVGAGARGHGAAGGAATLRAPVHRPRVPDQPVRLPGRPAAPAGRRRAASCAGTGSTWCCSTRSLWCPFPDGSSIALWSDADRTAAGDRRDLAVRRGGLPGVRGAVRADPVRAAHRGPRTPGSATARTGPSWASCWPTTRRRVEVLLRRLDRRRRRGTRRRRAAARAAARPGRDRHLGRTARPGHGRRARDARDGHAGRRPAGGTCAAVPVGSPSRWPTPRSSTGPCWPPGSRSARSSRGSGCGWPVASWSGPSVVVSNADPKRTHGAVRGATCRSRGGPGSRGWRSSSPVLKINCALRRLPRFTAAPDSDLPHRAMVTITSGIDATQAGVRAGAARAAGAGLGGGLLPVRLRPLGRPGRAST